MKKISLPDKLNDTPDDNDKLIKTREYRAKERRRRKIMIQLLMKKKIGKNKYTARHIKEKDLQHDITQKHANSGQTKHRGMRKGRKRG